MKPFTVECSIFANNFPGIANTDGKETKKVTLAGDNSTKDGHQLVDKLGDYEFWVVSGETLSDKKESELFTYKAEIRNMKTGIVAQAKSDDKIKPVGSVVIKSAEVSLVSYEKGSLLATSTLRMNCHHKPSQNQEALKFSH